MNCGKKSSSSFGGSKLRPGMKPISIIGITLKPYGVNGSRSARDPHDEPEPWTWVRWKARVGHFTASGHDERVWNHSSFHQPLKQGILWAVGITRMIRISSRIASHSSMKSATISQIMRKGHSLWHFNYLFLLKRA